MKKLRGGCLKSQGSLILIRLHEASIIGPGSLFFSQSSKNSTTYDLCSDVGMEGLLTPVSTSYRDSEQTDALVEVPKPVAKSIATTPAEALEILRNEPEYATLVSTLRYLDKNEEGFDLTSPSPLVAQIVHTLVSDVVLNYWSILYEPRNVKSSDSVARKPKFSAELELLLSCLRSVIGLNAVLLQLKQQVQEARASKKEVGGHNVQDTLAILLQLLQTLLEGTKSAFKFWAQIYKTCDTAPKQKAVWNELLSAIGGGKILSISAEAEDVINDLSKTPQERHWIADGKQYSLWLAQNVSYWAKTLSPGSENGWSNCGELLSKSLRLGHSGKNFYGLQDTSTNETQKTSSRSYWHF